MRITTLLISIALVDQDTGEVLDGVVVYCGVKQNPSYAFRLNPYYGWKGKVKNLNDYRREEEDRERRELKERHLRAVDSKTNSDDPE